MRLNFSFNFLYWVFLATCIAMDHEHLTNQTSTLHVNGVQLMHRLLYLLKQNQIYTQSWIHTTLHYSLTPWDLAVDKVPFKVQWYSVYSRIAELPQGFGLLFHSSHHYEQIIYCTTEGFYAQILLINCKVIIHNCKEMNHIPIRCTLLEYHNINLSSRYIFYMWIAHLWKITHLLHESACYVHLGTRLYFYSVNFMETNILLSLQKALS